MIYNVLTMNRMTKRTIVQCTCDQQRQVSLCIDPLYKASFLDSPESEEGAYCPISEGSDQNVMLQSHCLFQENKICISCKLSPLHEMSNPVFLVIKQITIFFLFIYLFFLSSAELAQIVAIRYPRALSVVSLSKTLYPLILVLVSTQEDAA